MFYFPLSALINALTSLILGIFVLITAPKKDSNKAFVYFCFAVFIWSFGYFFWQISENSEQALFWTKFLTFGSALIPFFYLFFTLKFVGYESKKIYYWGLPVLILLLLSFSDLLVSGIEKRMYFDFWPIPGILYPFFLTIFGGYTIASSILLYYSYKKSTGLLREQIKFILLGFIIGFIGGSTNFLLWYNIHIPPVLNVLVSAYVIFTAYAILKYRFMDIRLIIKRSAVFAILVVAITAIYAVSAFLITVFFQDLIGTQSTIINGVIVAIFVAIGFEPLKKYLSKVTDSFLFKGSYNAEELLSSLTAKINATLNLKQILNTISKNLNDAFRSEKFSIFIYDQEKDCFEEKSLAGLVREKPMCLPGSQIKSYYNALKQYGMERKIIIRDELAKLHEYKNLNGHGAFDSMLSEITSHQVNAVVPVYLHSELIGLFFVGDKKSGDVYTDSDLKVMQIVAGQSATAIDNAKLYEKQMAFNQMLKDEVAKATAELKVANRELKKLDKAKSEFISIASHQLRTPLTAIRGYVSMINDGDFGPVPEKILTPLGKVDISTTRIITLVEDLLNISRIESGRMQYEFEKVNFKQIIDEVCQEVKVIADKKHLPFVCQITSDNVPPILIDAKKIREVVMNLADNAIKYTEKGQVIVKLEKKDNELIYSVTDTGKGIDKNDMDKLFKKFSRVEGSSMIQAGGTGLGLFIAKKIVDKHNGRIWAESSGEDKGSTFNLALKIENKKLEGLLKKLGTNVLEKRN